jgi:hypothetical protein
MKTLAERIAEQKAKARRAARQNAMADRKYVAEMNKKIRAAKAAE